MQSWIVALIIIIIVLAFRAKEQQGILEHLLKQKNNAYNKLIAEKERKENTLNLAKTTANSIITDSLEDFEKSKIIELFRQKKEFRQGATLPNNSEWRALEIQFSKQMPATHNTLTKEKKLSPLELHTCILLILGFEDGAIANLTNSIPQTITTVKSRANKKIFNAKGAKTLRTGLLQLIKANVFT